MLGDFDPRAASQFELLHVNYDLDERATDELLRDMDAVGFDRGEDSDGLPTQQHNRAAAFALSEMMTGVRLTADIATATSWRPIRNASYRTMATTAAVASGLPAVDEDSRCHDGGDCGEASCGHRAAVPGLRSMSMS
ncbi:hypothetical protein SAMN04488550_0678 [Gordonia malaquae]|uniref:Uncharacterized protein n=1 Tax=Gordonia malaquae NBRC 108250 TaxID=1223542 RepID=M3TJU2_GORML|nr:hypothetical protein GM1_043_00190 [Gordonia malaquae NBRC 108250]SEB72066.1 hypothetical protein SAMN04488550_0678 [Gordonia malaquae]